MNTRRWMVIVLLITAWPVWRTVAIGSARVFRQDGWSWNDVSYFSEHDTVVEHRAVRTEKGFTEPPPILLDRFPTLIVRPDTHKENTGILIDLDSGVPYRMPLLDKELFDRHEELLPKRFLYDRLIDEGIRLSPKDAWVLPKGEMRSFPNFREDSHKPQFWLMPPTIVPPKSDVYLEVPPKITPPDDKN